MPITLVDLDVYGRQSTRGGALVHKNDLAVSNAIVLFLTSNQGDYLYQPGKGGIMMPNLFKNITESRLRAIQEDLSQQLESAFGSVVNNVQIDVTFDEENRMLELSVFYSSNLTNATNQAVVFFNNPETSIKRDSQGGYIPIAFQGDNLIAFITIQQTEFPNHLLTFDSNEGAWVWGPFKFSFIAGDADYEIASSMING